MPTSQEHGNTQKTRMRSLESDTILTTKEAARLLGISDRMVRNYVTSGALRRYQGEKRGGIYVSLHELSALASLRCTTDLPTIASTATKALARAADAAARLSRVETLLGLDVPHLSVEEDEVVAFHRQCVDVLSDYTESLPTSDVLDWAYKFAAVTEEYLSAIATHTGTHEPWVPLMDAAQKLDNSAPRSSFHYRKDLESAYGYLASARRHLREVAYFFIRRVHGPKAADAACPEQKTTERDERIIRLIFMMKK